MNNYLDKAFDIITYSTVAVCFISAVVFIVLSVIESNTGKIYSAALLIGLGIAMSLFIFYIKSWTNAK